MYKKLLLLVPLVLLALNATSFAIYKDTVNLDKTFQHASPGHWKINVHAEFHGTLDDNGLANSSSKPKSLSDDANFKGFPAGAYFTNSDTKKTDSYTSTVTVKGWSWFWVLANSLVLLGSLYYALRVNWSTTKKVWEVVKLLPRRRKSSNK